MYLTKLRQFIAFARTPSEKDLYGVVGMGAVETFLLRNWWVLLFLLACTIICERSIASHRAERDGLFQQTVQLQQQKVIAAAKQEDLLRQINSQSDPQFVELLLMRELGLVPENQIKVFFSDTP